MKTPQTLVRVGRYDNSLEEAVKRFTESLVSVPVGLGNTVKYAILKKSEESYLLMVSQQKDKLVTVAGYNVMLTVTSYSDSRNQQVADQFERKTGIDLGIDVPDHIRRQSNLMGMSFQVFEKHPKAAMDVLRGGI